tara:strand:+ start:6498 stop:6920 length:423 start_codon:yes stop_codon:yes gene_type:complete
MAANTAPIFSLLGDIQFTTAMTVANTTKDLTAGTSYLAFTADATNGGFVQRIRLRPLGTNSNATVARVWINNGSTTGSAANNALFDEITLTVTTGTETAALATFELPLNFALPPGDKIYVTLGTAPTSAGWQATVIGGKY